MRLDILLAHGGVYADLDTVFVNPLPERLFHERFVLGREHDVPASPAGGVALPSLCNALIMAEPGAEFARLWRGRMHVPPSTAPGRDTRPCCHARSPMSTRR